MSGSSGSSTAGTARELTDLMSQSNRQLQALRQGQQDTNDLMATSREELRKVKVKRTVEELCREREAARQDNDRNMCEVPSRKGTLEEKWETFWQEEEVAREKFAEYFEDQEKMKQELLEQKDRLEEAEHRREGHGLGTTSSTTSPTRSQERPGKEGKEDPNEDMSQYDDRRYFEVQEQMEDGRQQVV